MSFQKVKICICYEDIPQSRDKALPLLQHFNESKHWVLIFKAHDWCMRLELHIDKDKNIRPGYKGIDFRDYEMKKKDLHELATYLGFIEDINSIVENHKMNSTGYITVSNNCQHYAAAVLAELKLLSSQDTKKCPVGRERKMWRFTKEYYKVMKVLGRQRIGGGYKHISNNIYRGLKGVAISVALPLVAQIAEIATVTVIPYSGFLGWCGYTTTTTTISLLPIPAIALGIVLIAGCLVVTPELVEETLCNKQQKQRSENIKISPTKNYHKVPYVYSQDIITKKYSYWHEECY